MPNIITILKIGIKHGSIVGTPLLLMKTLCRITVLTGSVMAIHCLNVSPPRNDRLMHLNSPSSGLS